MSNAPSGKSRGGVVKRHTTLPRKPLDSLPGELARTHVALLPPPHGRAGSGGERLTARVLWHRYCCTRALARDRRVVTMRRRGVRPRRDGGLPRDAVRSRRTTNRARTAQRLTLARRERRYPMKVNHIGKGAQLAATALLLSGCTALTREVLVDERARPTPPNATTVSHCSGSEWQD